MNGETNVTPIHGGVMRSSDTHQPPPGLTFHANHSKARSYVTPEALFAQQQREAWPFGEMPTEAIARLTGYHPTTVRRWQRTRRLPKSMRLLWHVLVHGDLGAVHPEWDGWYIRDRGLTGPGLDQPLKRNALEHFTFSSQRVPALEATIRRLEAMIAEMKVQEAQAELSARERRERAQALKAIGAAELFMGLASKLEAMIGGNKEPSRFGQSTEDQRGPLRSAAELYLDLVQRVDPETGAAFWASLDE